MLLPDANAGEPANSLTFLIGSEKLIVNKSVFA